MANLRENGTGLLQNCNSRRGCRYGLGLVSLLLLSVVPSGWAETTTAQQAEIIVRGWLRSDATPLDAEMSNAIAAVDTYVDEYGDPIYYVVNLDPEGFVIVPAEDRVEPIVAFSDKGVYDASPEHPLGALVGADLLDRVSQVRELPPLLMANGDDEVTPESKWELFGFLGESEEPLLMGTSSISDVWVDKLIQSQWSQSTVGGQYCYNYYTPNHYVCGCVATAFAQVIRYHQHPTTGIGVHSFSVTVDGGTQTLSTRGGNGSGGAYNYANMPLIPADGCTAAQREAIGALCYDCGVTVHMNYGASGSGAQIYYVKVAMTDTFGYANAVYASSYPNNFAEQDLNNMVNTNLDAGYPVQLGIYGDGGHAVIADGYGYNSGTLYHHINMGWAGSADAWYDLPNIGTGYNFDTVAVCVYNTFITGSGEIISGRVTDENGNPLAGITVTATRSGGGSYQDTTDANGIYALAKVPSGSDYTVTASHTNFTFNTVNVTTGTSADYDSSSGNRWGINLTATTAYDAAEMISPTPDSELTSASPTFTWTAGSDVTLYELYIGSNAGGSQYFHIGGGTTELSAVAQGLPTDGSTVHVRLYSQIDGEWRYNDYTYTAFNATNAEAAQITSPSTSSPLPSTSPTFTWDSGSGADEYQILIGSSAGASDYFLKTTTSTSVQATDLPNDGSTLHVRLRTRCGADWLTPVDYVYTAYAPSGTAGSIGNYSDGDALASSAPVFTITGAVNATEYYIYAGPSVGSASFDHGGSTETSIQLHGLPTDGRDVYVRLWSLVSGEWLYRDYQFVAFDISAAVAAEIQSPATGSPLPSASPTFTWDAGTGVHRYELRIGSSAGGTDYYQITTTATSIATQGLPHDGSTVHVRLTSWVGTTPLAPVDYVYTAYAPVGTRGSIGNYNDGDTLGSANPMFTITGAVNATQFYVYAGPSVGSAAFDHRGTTTTSIQMQGLPSDGRDVYVRLWSLVSGEWLYNDYQFTAFDVAAAAAAEIQTPAVGALPSTSPTFTWDAGTGVDSYELLVGSSAGAADYYYTDTTATSATAIGLPDDGSDVHVRLISWVGDTALPPEDYVYTSWEPTGERATMQSPAPDAVLSASETFQWTAGTNVDLYMLYIGSGPRKANIFFTRGGTLATSVTVNNLPQHGGTLYVTLYSNIGGVWFYEEYTYTAGP